VGNKSPQLTHVSLDALEQNEYYQMDLVVREVNRRLYDDSTFFSDMRAQELPGYQLDGKI
jgi:hypothetical protein